MSQRLGIAFVKVDGELLESMPGAKIDIGGKTRSTVLGANAVLGFSETPAPASVECEISIGPKTSLKKLRGITNATITFECDTGQTYVINGAWLEGTLVATSGDGGKVPLKFVGPPAEEMAK